MPFGQAAWHATAASHANVCTFVFCVLMPGGQIDDLRREHVTFDSVYEKMEREVAERKKMMSNVIEVRRCAHGVECLGPLQAALRLARLPLHL